MELPSHCCRHSLSPPAPSSVAHHTFCKASCLTARVLQGFRLHTTHPANFAPLVLEACQLHSTHPASLQASHHTSCKPILFHTTRPASLHPSHDQGASHHTSFKPISPHTTSCKPTCFTPHILRASHHTSCKPSCFTPLVLRDSHHTSWKLISPHTTHPASLHASHHSSCELHTTRPVGRFCFTPLVLQAHKLHTTCLASFTPHVL